MTVTGEDALFFSRLVGSRIVQGLIDQWAIDPREDGKGPQGVQLRVDALPTSAAVLISVVLLAPNSATQLWSCSETIPLDAGRGSDTPRLQVLISRSIEIAGFYLNRIGTSAEGSQAFTQGFEAVQRMFKIDRDQVDRADELLRMAHELDPKRFTWLGAPMRAVSMSAIMCCTIAAAPWMNPKSWPGERSRPIRTTRPSSRWCHTSTALSCGNLRSATNSRNRASRATPRTRSGMRFSVGRNPISATTRLDYRETRRALQLSGQTPYQYTLHFLYGMTALLSGRLNEAVRASEISCALAPTYRPPQRYLVPLYLKLGERDKARAAFERLRRLEPTFSLDAMRDASYPSTGIRASGLLTFSDRDL